MKEKSVFYLDPVHIDLFVKNVLRNKLIKIKIVLYANLPYKDVMRFITIKKENSGW